ncbi:transposase [Oceaniovalibus guishaninsula]|uniref:transposase n=1 Tax=Oceaniovalibus guishaninsula TaxID=1046117 RepID=UPI0012EA870B|nr:transposase [Oceaniovalibus guishaninsula]
MITEVWNRSSIIFPTRDLVGVRIETPQVRLLLPPNDRTESDWNLIGVARRNGIAPNLLYHWRRLMLGEALDLESETYELAGAVAPGWDIRRLEQEWRNWMMEPSRDPDRAFAGFCRKWFEKRGRP